MPIAGILGIRYTQSGAESSIPHMGIIMVYAVCLCMLMPPFDVLRRISTILNRSCGVCQAIIGVSSASRFKYSWPMARARRFSSSPSNS